MQAIRGKNVNGRNALQLQTYEICGVGNVLTRTGVLSRVECSLH